MLQDIRDKVQGWFAWTVVIIIALIFGFIGLGDYFAANRDANVAATVGGTKISWAEVDALYERFLREGQGKNIPDEAIKDSILANLVQQRALLLASKERGLRVGESQVKDIILSIPAFQENGVFQAQRYAALLKQYNFTDLQFRNNIEESLLVNQLQSALIESAFSLPKDINRIVKLSDQKRDIRYAVIKSADLAEKLKDKATPEALDAYYKAHSGLFKSDDSVKVAYLRLKLDDIKKQLNPSVDELKAYYETNIQSFITPARAHAAHILISLEENASEEARKAADAKLQDIQQQIKSGAKFEELAQKYSDDSLSSAKGGDLGWIASGDMADMKALESQILSLNKPGEISAPVQTQFGLHLVQLIDKKAEVKKPFAEVQKEVHDKMVADAAEKQLFEKTEKMMAAAFEHSESLEMAAKVAELPIAKTQWFTRHTAQDVFANPKVQNILFSDEVLTKGHNSEMIELAEGDYLVVRADEYKPSVVLPFEEVKDKVRSAYLNEQLQKHAIEKGMEYTKAIESGTSLATLAAKEGLSIKTEKEAPRMLEHVSQVLLNDAFSIPRSELARTAKFSRDEEGNFILVTVDKIIDGNVQSLDKEKEKMLKLGVARTYGETDYLLYQDHILNDVKIQKETSKKATKSENTNDISTEPSAG